MQTSVLQLSTFSSGFPASFQSTFAKGFNHSVKRASYIQTLLIGSFFPTHKNKMSKRKQFALKQVLKPTTAARHQPRFHPTHLRPHRLHLHQQKETRIAFAAAVATNLTALLISFTMFSQIQLGTPRPRPRPHHAGTTWKKTSASTTTTALTQQRLPINKYKRQKTKKNKKHFFILFNISEIS